MHHDRSGQREQQNDKAKEGVGAAAHAARVERDTNQTRHCEAPEQARERIGEGVRGHVFRYGFLGGAGDLPASAFGPPASAGGEPGRPG